jgi:HPt (histidine-containing phosphotransfer) domain-containing protein
VAIKRLKATLGNQAAEMLPALIDNFFKDAVKLQEDARQAFEHNRSEDLRRAAHTFKSTSKHFGATALAELCQELEHQAQNGMLEDTENVLTQIEAEYENVRAALEILRKDL